MRNASLITFPTNENFHWATMNAQQTAKCGKVLNSKKCYVMSMLCQVTEANSKKFCFNATCTCSGPNVHTAEKKLLITS